MKAILYWSAYVLIILGIIIWSLISMLGCTIAPNIDSEVIEIEHVDLDSLSHMADSAINDVHHTIEDLDNDVKVKEKKIRRQLAELKRAETNAEARKQEALAQIERARIEKAEVDSAMVILEREFEVKWDAYERELLLLEKDITTIVHQLNTAVEEITVVVLQFGQESMFYDETTKIHELIKYLPEEKLDSIINNTSTIYKIKKTKGESY